MATSVVDLDGDIELAEEEMSGLAEASGLLVSQTHVEIFSLLSAILGIDFYLNDWSMLSIHFFFICGLKTHVYTILICYLFF